MALRVAGRARGFTGHSFLLRVVRVLGFVCKKRVRISGAQDGRWESVGRYLRVTTEPFSASADVDCGITT